MEYVSACYFSETSGQIRNYIPLAPYDHGEMPGSGISTIRQENGCAMSWDASKFSEGTPLTGFASARRHTPSAG